MIILAAGDSFIFGSELSDCHDGGYTSNSQLVWPALIAKRNNYDYQSIAYPGHSNHAISREVATAVNNQKFDNVTVLVSWTFTSRYEFMFDDQWFNINPWHTDPKRSFDSRGIDADRIRDLSEQVFRNSSRYWELYETLKEIVFLQNLLNQHDINYIFTTSNNEYYQIDFNPDYGPQGSTWQERKKQYDKNPKTAWNITEPLNILYNSIDWSRWVFLPPGKEANETQAPRGFYQWALENKYSIAPMGHPLEEAHHDASLLLEDKFNELVKKNNQ